MQTAYSCFWRKNLANKVCSLRLYVPNRNCKIMIWIIPFTAIKYNFDGSRIFLREYEHMWEQVMIYYKTQDEELICFRQRYQYVSSNEYSHCLSIHISIFEGEFFVWAWGSKSQKNILIKCCKISWKKFVIFSIFK